MKIGEKTQDALALIVLPLMLGATTQAARWQVPVDEIAKLLAYDGAPDDYFGRSAAMDGDIAVLGAADDDDNGNESGSAYVFRRDDNGTPYDPRDDSWLCEDKLLASDGAPADYFGWSVGVSGDLIVVGAPGDDVAGHMTGSAYVFQHDDNGTPEDHSDDFWPEVAKLLNPGMTWGDEFGWSVAISGETIAIGAPGDDTAGNRAGAAWVFYGPNWTPVAQMMASDAAPFDGFGAAVAIDGDALVIGAPAHDHNGADCGSAYVFRGPGWIQQDELQSPGGVPGDHFGASVAISADTVLIGDGAHDDGNNGSDSGAAYVFRFDANTGAWPPEATLLAWDAGGGNGENDRFGCSVAVYADTALIGTPEDEDNGMNSGSAYVFWRDDNGTPGNPNDDFWVDIAKLLASDGGPFDYFGHAVALSGDTGLLGAFGDGDNGSNSGSAYVFARCFADLNGDGTVGLPDLAQLLSNYGSTSGAAYDDGDLDGDGDVDLADLAALLATYGTACL